MNQLLSCLVAVLSLVCPMSHAQGGARSPSEDEASQAMTATADPSFEVATIRISDPNHPVANTPIGHQIVFGGTTLLFLTAFVYDLHQKEIVGAPDWMANEKFDFVGVADTPGTPSLQQLKIMFRKLFADRFQLKLHTEQRELSAYVLTVEAGGPRLAGSTADASALPSLLGSPQTGMKGRNISMREFAHLLQSGILDRPVVDRTGLAGKYDFVLQWTPDETQFNQVGARSVSPGEGGEMPGLFTAMREQLGLKVSAARTSVDVLVVDHVERPSGN